VEDWWDELCANADWLGRAEFIKCGVL